MPKDQEGDFETYSVSEEEARKRLLGRDPDDWPVLAAALVFNCPIWTEDTDFFGAGVTTWTTDRVEMFLQGGSARLGTLAWSAARISRIGTK